MHTLHHLLVASMSGRLHLLFEWSQLGKKGRAEGMGRAVFIGPPATQHGIYATIGFATCHWCPVFTV
jgi:hypothetical protein